MIMIYHITMIFPIEPGKKTTNKQTATTTTHTHTHKKTPLLWSGIFFMPWVRKKLCIQTLYEIFFLARTFIAVLVTLIDFQGHSDATKMRLAEHRVFSFNFRNPQCEIAVQVFKNCPIDRTDAINSCQKLLTYPSLMKCLGKYGADPMNIFVYCLKYKCNNDAESCDLLKEALDGCPSIPAYPAGTVCPISGTP